MRPKKSARSRKTRGASAVGSWTLSLAVCIVAAAVFIVARQPLPVTEITTVHADQVMPTPVARNRARTTAVSAPVPVPEPVIEREPAATTITGCLERDDEAFRLRDTMGAEAPRARSWKTGFLKKSPASIEVVDAGNGLNLPNHVGRRVSVSGTRVDREMRARSVRRAAGSCE